MLLKSLITESHKSCNNNLTELSISAKEMTNLQDRAKDICRAPKYTKPRLGKKMCPTRHGCQGATDCNYSYADYPG